MLPLSTIKFSIFIWIELRKVRKLLKLGISKMMERTRGKGKRE
jgi:hypothetical protein